LITTKTMGMVMGKGMSKTLPGLDNFYMVGQWVEPGGGVPTAALSGRNVIQVICQQDNRPFVTQVAQLRSPDSWPALDSSENSFPHVILNGA